MSTNKHCFDQMHTCYCRSKVLLVQNNEKERNLKVIEAHEINHNEIIEDFESKTRFWKITLQGNGNYITTTPEWVEYEMGKV